MLAHALVRPRYGPASRGGHAHTQPAAGLACVRTNQHRPRTHLCLATARTPCPCCAAPTTSRPRHTPEHAHASLSLACFARAILKAAPLPGLGLALGRLDRTTLGPCLLGPYLADAPPPTRRRRSTTTKSGRRRCWTTSQPPQLLIAAVEAFPLCRRCLQSALSTTRRLWNPSSPSSP